MTAAFAGGLAAAARCLALDAAAAAAVAALADAGIASVLLKGPGLASRLYPENPGHRTYTDVDLLVSPVNFGAAERLFSRLEYREVIEDDSADEWQSHEHGWRAPGPSALVVDLHRGFAGVGDPAAFWSALWSTSEILLLANVRVRVPDAAGAALLLALHAATPAHSVKPRVDLLRGLDILANRDWRVAAELSRTTSSEPAFAVGLRLTPAGTALADRLCLPLPATPLEWLAAHPVDATTHGLAKLAAAPDLRTKAHLLRLRVLPSPEYVRYFSPLARRGVGGLILAYAARFGRHALRAPRGLIAVRAATVAARGASTTAGSIPARRSKPTRAALRAGGHRDIGAIHAGFWTLRVLHQARRGLRLVPVDQVVLSTPPRRGTGGGWAVAAVLRWREASCLERTLVTQYWDASEGVFRTLVIGVTAPGADFHAHAWLDGETTAERQGMVEILRRPWPNPMEKTAVDLPAGRGNRGANHRSGC